MEGPPSAKSAAPDEDKTIEPDGGNDSAEAGRGQAGRTLNQTRFLWLQCVAENKSKLTALQLRIVILYALNYVTKQKSRERFESDGDACGWPGGTMLAKELGCSRQAADQAQKGIANLGWFQLLKQGNGRGHSSEYALRFPSVKGKQLTCALSDGKGQAGKAGKGKQARDKGQAAHLPHSYYYSDPLDYSPLGNKGRNFSEQVNNKMNGSRNDYSEDPADHPEFNKLYAMWPDKEKDRRKAFGAWINSVVRPRVNSADVLKCGRAWCDHWEATEAKYHSFWGKWMKERGWKKQPPSMDRETRQYLEANRAYKKKNDASGEVGPEADSEGDDDYMRPSDRKMLVGLGINPEDDD